MLFLHVDFIHQDESKEKVTKTTSMQVVICSGATNVTGHEL